MNIQPIVIYGMAVLLAGAAVFVVFLLKKNRALKEELCISVSASKEAGKRKSFQEAMLPGQLLALFQNGDPEKIRLGEQRIVQAAVLSFNVQEFAKWIRTKTAEEIFRYINDVLRHVIPSVLYQEGEIDRFADAGLKAFFLKNPENALRAAISICESMEQKDGLKKEFSIGLSYGDVMAGMVGDERRFGTLTISETTGIADFLQEKARRYGAKILITGRMKQEIPEFEQLYHSRYLGKIRMTAADTMEDIYDVYDGDDPVSKNAKRKTKLLFEKGVSLFQEGRIYDARIYFIEVLKANRMDGAAKHYLYLCNQGQETEKKTDSYLEKY